MATTAADHAKALEQVGEKQVSPAVVRRSVQATEVPTITAPGESLIFWIATMAESIQAWGTLTKSRDRQLRAFVLKEDFLRSALGVVAARNAAFGWKLDGPPRTVARIQSVLTNVNFGQGGWPALMAQLSWDLYGQDDGAYLEIVRASDSPDAPVIGINNLDAARCYQTGDLKEPVIYVDRLGQFHRLKWYEVYHLLEMPHPLQTGPGPAYKIQQCAVTRLLGAAQILRNVSQYKEEKTGGRFTRAINFVRGVTAKQVKAARAEQESQADQAGLQSYIQPLIVASIDPTVEVGVTTMELASLPDGFDEEKTIKNYITVLAMAFLTDYQEFAPLPGGGLGSSAQSEILHMKSRGKGPALYQKLIIHMMNHGGILPKNVEFKFEEPDFEAMAQEETLHKTRAETRQIMLASGEITTEMSLQMAVDAGDVSEDIVEAMGPVDMTENVQVSDEERASGAKALHRKDRCMECSAPPTWQVWWAEGRALAWFCDKHYAKWTAANPGEEVAKRRIKDGVVEDMPCPGSAIRSGGQGRGLGTGRGQGPIGVPVGQKVARPVRFGEYVISRLHRAYAEASDDAVALGYFDDTKQRASVTEAVGDALQAFEGKLKAEGTYGIQLSLEDADRMFQTSSVAEQFKELAGQELDEDEIDDERLELEGLVKKRALRALHKMGTRIESRLRREYAGD